MWVPDRSTEATVVDEVDHRSYEVETSDGTYRRNRRDIVLLPEQPIRDESSESTIHCAGVAEVPSHLNDMIRAGPN